MIRLRRFRSPHGAQLTLLGGIFGLASDADLLRTVLAERPYNAILLGVPFEDLDAIRSTSGTEATREFDQDAADEVYLEQLKRFAPPVVPPPDLYAAYAHAAQNHLPVEAIDLGDEAHADLWARSIGLFELMRNNRSLKRLPTHSFQAATLEDFALEWDRVTNSTKGLKKIQAEREAWMATRIEFLARTHRQLLALVPFARLVGVSSELVTRLGFAEDANTRNR